MYDDVELDDERAFVQYYGADRYIIFIASNQGLSDEEKRILVAHELSHILISLLDEENYNPTTRSYSDGREYVASLLSVLMVLSRSSFYEADKENFIYNDDDKLKELIGKAFAKYPTVS